MTAMIVHANAKPHPGIAKLQQLQAQRMNRVKHLGRTIVRTLKHVDTEARDLVIQDMKEFTVAVTDALTAPPAPEPAPVTKTNDSTVASSAAN